MSSFKLAKKNALSDNRTNIYYLHEKKLQSFEDEKNKLPEYKEELRVLQEKCKTNHLIKFEIKNLENKIDDIINDTLLNEYLLDFFSLINTPENSYEELSQKGKMDTFVNSKVNNSRIELYNNYIAKFNVDLEPINLNIKNKMVCKCGSSNLSFDHRQSTEVCLDCGTYTELFLTDTEPGFSNTVEKETVFNYERPHHFQECLNQLQAKENTTIPPKIIDDLKSELKKYNINNPKMFTRTLIRNYLKKLKYGKYYEHVPTIINLLCGLPAPKMTPDLEQQLKLMFDEVQIPFEKYRKIYCPDRQNFLNYNYTFYKMLQLLNRDEFLGYFDLLKSREKLYEHDQIWKGICKDLRWEFVPSI
jgi:hypothetical protein